MSRPDVQTRRWLRALHDDDRVALVLARTGETTVTQRVFTLSALLDEAVMRWVRYENAKGANVYVSVNPLRAGTSRRRKEDVAEVRALVLDFDQDGDARLERIRSAKSDLPDATLVGDELANHGTLELVGGLSRLDELADCVPSPKSLEHYAAVVSRHARKRSLIAIGSEMAQNGFDRQLTAEETIAQVENHLTDLWRDETKGRVKSGVDIAKEAIQFVEAQSLGRREPEGLTTGIRDLDASLGGIRPGQLVILAGRTSHGKTALALNIARHLALDEHKSVLFFSLEMTERELILRLISADTKVDFRALQHGHLRDEDWRRIVATQNRLAVARAFFNTEGTTSLLDIRACARQVKAEHGLDAIVVDYMQLMPGGGNRYESRQIEIATISRGLKLLAKELGVPVIALSQLSRQVDNRGATARPRLADLRESGARAARERRDRARCGHRDVRLAGGSSKGQPDESGRGTASRDHRGEEPPREPGDGARHVSRRMPALHGSSPRK